MHTDNAVLPQGIHIMHSLIDPLSLPPILRENYGFQHSKCILLHHGFNDTYLINEPDTAFVLRIYRYGWRTPQEIESECHILWHLQTRDVAIAPPILTVDKTYGFAIHAPEGIRECVLFAKAPGNIPLAIDSASLKQHGRILGKLHNAFDSITFEVIRPKLNQTYLLESSLETLQTTFPQYHKRIIALEERLKAPLKSDSPFNANWCNIGLVHGDFLRSNFFACPDGHVTLFDFDFCGFSNRMYDLATYKWSLFMTQPETVHDLFDMFITSYSEQIAVSEEMLGWLDWFVDVRHLWVWTINIRHGVEFQRLNEHQFHHKMAFYKL